jgi:hypothetical protein
VENEINELKKRVSWLERQHRMLLGYILLDDHRQFICVDSRCQNGPCPHVAEQPYGCPNLGRNNGGEAETQA